MLVHFHPARGKLAWMMDVLLRPKLLGHLQIVFGHIR
jgi:hypothetical protein